MSEMDVQNYAAQPWVATASDGGIAWPGDGPVHPRFYGTFPRKIRHYALTAGALSLESAIRAQTSLPARIAARQGDRFAQGGKAGGVRVGFGWRSERPMASCGASSRKVIQRPIVSDGVS